MTHTAPPTVALDRRMDLPPAFDERTALTAMLTYVRLTVHAKCADLAQHHAAAVPVPTSPLTTIAGIVNHLRWVETYWIDVAYLGGEDRTPSTIDDPDVEMRAGPQRPLAELLAGYAAQAAHTDEILASRDWDSESVRRNRVTGRPLALRWIVLSLIEETARHNGHLDLLREMADGVTGL
jgi:hypothetical protein